MVRGRGRSQGGGGEVVRAVFDGVCEDTAEQVRRVVEEEGVQPSDGAMGLPVVLRAQQRDHRDEFGARRDKGGLLGAGRRGRARGPRVAPPGEIWS